MTDLPPPDAPQDEPSPSPTEDAVHEPAPTEDAVHEPAPTEDAVHEPAPTEDAPPEPAPPHASTHAPPPGYGTYPPMRRLYRSRHDRKLGGVSAGLAEYFRIDPTIVRLAMAFFFLTGIGILVYAAAWMIVPQRPEGLIDPVGGVPAADERTMTYAFGIAGLALVFGIATGSWAVLAIALIAGGIWLLSERSAVTPGAATPFAGAPPTSSSPPGMYEPMYYAPPTAAPGYGGSEAASGGYSAPPMAPYQSAPVPVRERKPQRITWIVLSCLALLASIGIAAASGDWWDVSATRFVGIGIVIIGVGVLAGQFRGGGARGLIPLGILALLTLLPVSAVDGLLDDGVGEATYRPTTIAELEDSYEHGVGKLVVDLSGLDFEGRSETVNIDLGIGELIVIVSSDTGGQAVLQAKAGEISHYLPQTDSVLFEEGVNIETGLVRLEGANGTLDLNIEVGLGTAELRSEAG